MWGRLAPGVSMPSAEQELLSLTNQLRKIYPTVIWDHEYIVVTPGAHFFSFEGGPGAPPVLALVGLLVFLILAIACANLGGLLMARGAGRQREIQLRFDLGARKLRVFRQLLTENLLLGLLGSVAALPLSYGVLRLVLVYSNAPAWMSALPDWRVFLFTSAMGFVAALLFGLLPTLQMVRRKKNRSLWHQFVVCAQVGASCVLLILAGLLVRATLHTLYSDPGFGYEQVLSIDPGMSEHGFASAQAQAYLDQLQNRLRAVPGVTFVSIARVPPLVNTMVMITSIDVDGRRVMIYPNWVGPEFFQTMRIPLLRGRYFRAGEKNVVILSESLARKRWPAEDPIGKQWEKSNDVVIGVVGNTRAMELNNTDATEIYYPPTADDLPAMSVLVRAAGDPNTLTPTIKAIAGGIDTALYPTITPLTAGFRKNVSHGGADRDDHQLAGWHRDLSRGRGPPRSRQLRRIATDQGNRHPARARGQSLRDIFRCVAAICLARSGRAGCRSGHHCGPLADFAACALRHQRSRSNQLHGRDGHPDRYPRCGCVAANSSCLSARHSKNSAFRVIRSPAHRYRETLFCPSTRFP